MPAPLTPIETTPDLPTHADVVIIGGGIIGCLTAYYLSKRGLKVALVEKGRIDSWVFKMGFPQLVDNVTNYAKIK